MNNYAFFSSVLIVVLNVDKFCPPLGNDSDRYVVDALSEDWPRIGGCANKQLRNRMDFWLGPVDCDNISCRYKSNNKVCIKQLIHLTN